MSKLRSCVSLAPVCVLGAPAFAADADKNGAGELQT